ncbi:hypothetical protein [Amycolatopsis rifamycinica]|uniref:Beta-lactamase n=1 Tax=Amycolatopsis rifamycinica TaxID=287986 RepID=A0A066TWG3_9PSEU|nr:hypothetical protein [Amycolatopsis rifamycinica]KDN19541.1 beta-lactamase [Amycolatopsis rifamycinica]
MRKEQAHVLAISAVTDESKFWNGLKKAHGRLPAGAVWKLAIASRDGTRAVNVIAHGSADAVREFFEAHAGAHATTEYFEADAANAVGLAR